jgi:dTDP-4-dehydrorhamnose 3,5-epimerase-like enzyme
MNIQNSLLKDKNIGIVNYHDNQLSYRIKDNYVNATQIAQLFNKVVWEWLRYDSTKEYINTLEIELGTDKLIEIGLGSPKNGGGLWIHPILVNEIARWINNEEFIYWCESEFTNQTRLVA